MKIVPDNWDWNSYQYEYGDDKTAIVAYDEIAAYEKQHQGFPHCYRIRITFDPKLVDPNGLQSQLHLSTGLQNPNGIPKIEGFFAELIRQLVGRQYFGGLREHIFQVEGCAHFDQVVASWRQLLGDSLCTMHMSQGWTFFDKKIRPSPEERQHGSDALTIRTMIEAGSDPAKVHDIEHEIAGAPAQLEKLMAQLAPTVYTFVRSEPGMLRITHLATLDFSSIRQTTKVLLERCTALELQYDGWGATVST
jgi:regulator of RNase E activity RraB